jgi:hypothetical protein
MNHGCGSDNRAVAALIRSSPWNSWMASPARSATMPAWPSRADHRSVPFRPAVVACPRGRQPLVPRQYPPPGVRDAAWRRRRLQRRRPRPGREKGYGGELRGGQVRCGRVRDPWRNAGARLRPGRGERPRSRRAGQLAVALACDEDHRAFCSRMVRRRRCRMSHFRRQRYLERPALEDLEERQHPGHHRHGRERDVQRQGLLQGHVRTPSMNRFASRRVVGTSVLTSLALH